METTVETLPRKRTRRAKRNRATVAAEALLVGDEGKVAEVIEDIKLIMSEMISDDGIYNNPTLTLSKGSVFPIKEDKGEIIAIEIHSAGTVLSLMLRKERFKIME